MQRIMRHALFFLFILGTNSIFSMEMEPEIFVPKSNGEQETLVHDLAIALQISQAKSGNINAQKELSTLFFDSSTTPKQKNDIVTTFQEITKSKLNIHAHMAAYCELAYIYATYNGPKSETHQIVQAMRYLFLANKIVKENSQNKGLKNLLIIYIDRIAREWEHALSYFTTVTNNPDKYPQGRVIISQKEKPIFEAHLDLLEKLKKSLS